MYVEPLLGTLSVPPTYDAQPWTYTPLGEATTPQEAAKLSQLLLALEPLDLDGLLLTPGMVFLTVETREEHDRVVALRHHPTRETRQAEHSILATDACAEGPHSTARARRRHRRVLATRDGKTCLWRLSWRITSNPTFRSVISQYDEVVKHLDPDEVDVDFESAGLSLPRLRRRPPSQRYNLRSLKRMRQGSDSNSPRSNSRKRKRSALPEEPEDATDVPTLCQHSEVEGNDSDADMPDESSSSAMVLPPRVVKRRKVVHQTHLFTTLPTHIFIHLISFLSPKDNLSNTLISKDFNKMVSDYWRMETKLHMTNPTIDNKPNRNLFLAVLRKVYRGQLKEVNLDSVPLRNTDLGDMLVKHRLESLVLRSCPDVLTASNGHFYSWPGRYSTDFGVSLEKLEVSRLPGADNQCLRSVLRHCAHSIKTLALTMDRAFQCSHCGVWSIIRLKICAGCFCHRYCSKWCQQADWHDKHRQMCRRWGTAPEVEDLCSILVHMGKMRKEFVKQMPELRSNAGRNLTRSESFNTVSPPFSKLETLYLSCTPRSGFGRLGASTLSKFIPHFPQIKHLTLNCAARMDDEGIRIIVDNLKNLESLQVRSCKRLTGRSMEMLAELEHLTALDVTGCYGITDRSVRNFIRESKSSFKTLYLAFGVNQRSGQVVSGMSPDTLRYILLWSRSCWNIDVLEVNTTQDGTEEVISGIEKDHATKRTARGSKPITWFRNLAEKDLERPPPTANSSSPIPRTATYPHDRPPAPLVQRSRSQTRQTPLRVNPKMSTPDVLRNAPEYVRVRFEPALQAPCWRQTTLGGNSSSSLESPEPEAQSHPAPTPSPPATINQPSIMSPRRYALRSSSHSENSAGDG